MIPVSVIITTRNEEANIVRCLSALTGFGEVVVVDSRSIDSTVELAKSSGARVCGFTWNGEYPKKRQWCLDNLELEHDWFFFVDADEVVTKELKKEIEELFRAPPTCAGYFIKGRYVMGGRALRFGLRNNKLCLLDRRKVAFPVIDDLNAPGMGEIEGHYQPVLKNPQDRTGQLKAEILHYAYDKDWSERHERYAAWETAMNRKGAWPRDPVAARQVFKQLFRALPGRALWAFVHCYIIKLGLFDGRRGFQLAGDRYRYYRMIGR